VRFLEDQKEEREGKTLRHYPNWIYANQSGSRLEVEGETRNGEKTINAFSKGTSARARSRPKRLPRPGPASGACPWRRGWTAVAKSRQEVDGSKPWHYRVPWRPLVIYFLDTSALAKRDLREKGSPLRSIPTVIW